MELTAQRVEAAEMNDLDSYVLSLAENPDASGWQLIFMLPLHPCDQDRALGQDTYAITSHDAVTVYGGVTGWARSGGRFDFEVTDETASVLGVDEQFTVLVGDETSATQLEDALRRIVG